MVQASNGGVYRPQQENVRSHGPSPAIQSSPPTIPVCTITNLRDVNEKFGIIEKMPHSQVLTHSLTYSLTYSLTHSLTHLLTYSLSGSITRVSCY